MHITTVEHKYNIRTRRRVDVDGIYLVDKADRELCEVRMGRVLVVQNVDEDAPHLRVCS